MVRERDGKCRNCGKTAPYKLEAHHIWPRGRKSTRLLLENGITLCVHCHKFGDHSVHNIGTKAFMTPLIGKKELDRLEKLSNQTMSEREAINIFLTKYSTQHEPKQ